MQTHIVPVGFDYDRMIAPLIRDQFDVDRVILLEGTVGSEANVEYSRNIARKLEQDFQNLLGAETVREQLTDVYDYDAAFERAYDLINAELDRDEEDGTTEDGAAGDGAAGDGGASGEAPDKREVWVNLCSMPRPVSFAFATAAHSIMVERQDDRDRIHTYYTAPEKYLETELAEELRANRDLLQTLVEDDAVADDRLSDRLASTTDLLAEFDERGTTIGAKRIGDSHVIELPVASFQNVKPFEELVLFTLGEHGEFESVSELAETLAADLNEEYTDSFRSKVIYNVDRLGPGGKGYIEREERGKSYRTTLSRIGELWVRAHADEDRDLA
ncbi:HFX_2341 family transcriptional regulator [Halorubrum sp. N11]|uniref:HFX_2341 family transcriptional regulator n=1 Tax=Halorubrum sp. N11 TaxID=3402276 RepID=UPI003EBE10E9